MEQLINRLMEFNPLHMRGLEIFGSAGLPSRPPLIHFYAASRKLSYKLDEVAAAFGFDRKTLDEDSATSLAAYVSEDVNIALATFLGVPPPDEVGTTVLVADGIKTRNFDGASQNIIDIIVGQGWQTVTHVSTDINKPILIEQRRLSPDRAELFPDLLGVEFLFVCHCPERMGTLQQ